jgi:hypothetical protein
MSKIISLLMGSWMTYCAMIGSYGGAIVLLIAFVLIAFDPLNPNKKGTTAANSRTQK